MTVNPTTCSEWEATWMTSESVVVKREIIFADNLVTAVDLANATIVKAADLLVVNLVGDCAFVHE